MDFLPSAATNLLRALMYACAAATTTSVSAEWPENRLPSLLIRIVTSPKASIPSVTDFTENSINSLGSSVTEGIDALGEVTIRIRRDGNLFSGHSADTDVVVAAAQAYINALNRLVAAEGRKSIHPQHDLAQIDKKGV